MSYGPDIQSLLGVLLDYLIHSFGWRVRSFIPNLVPRSGFNGPALVKFNVINQIYIYIYIYIYCNSKQFYIT